MAQGTVKWFNSVKGYRQVEEHRALGLDALGPVGVGAADDLGDEAAIAVEIGEVARSAQRRRLPRLILIDAGVRPTEPPMRGGSCGAGPDPGRIEGRRLAACRRDGGSVERERMCPGRPHRQPSPDGYDATAGPSGRAGK